MLFEQAENKTSNMVSERKESKGEPPALQRFRQNQQQLQQDSKNEEDRPPVAQKPGLQPTLRQNSKTDAADTTDSSSTGGGGGGGVGKINVAKMFQQGTAPPPLKPVVPVKRPGALNSETSNSERPKVALKPPSKASPATSPVSPKPVPPTEKPPPSALKPSSFVTANGSAVVPNKQYAGTAPIKLPVMDGKPLLRKTDSSLSSGSSASSGSAKPSSPSLTNNNTNGPFDFRSHLKPRPSLGGKAEAAPSDSNKDLTHSEPSGKPDPVKRPNSSDNSDALDEIVERPSDSKRFKKVKLSSLPPAASEAPEKPDLPDGGVDLALICQQHANMLRHIADDDLPPPPPPEELVEEDIYDDGSTVVETRPPTNRPQRGRESNRISEIPTMTAEEEGLEEDDIYDDGATDAEIDLLYVDAASETKPAIAEEEEDVDSIYDDGDIVPSAEESEEAKKKRLKEEAEAKKREQKRQKEEEKRKKQQEKEEQKRRKKFNLTGDEKDIGEGIIKEDSRGWGNNLTVKKGDKVTIVRLDSNPANKFLVKTDSDSK
ncbi:FYN-binding protein [Elysia marginata]|uniref:FYN-binding protein n=1 Tax=Elysia marginata TaxID=1093978 RepID=A0AAV4FYN9_9GAST|nr:FYN-binding protein [Elysia marginata]